MEMGGLEGQAGQKHTVYVGLVCFNPYSICVNDERLRPKRGLGQGLHG